SVASTAGASNATLASGGGAAASWIASAPPSLAPHPASKARSIRARMQERVTHLVNRKSNALVPQRSTHRANSSKITGPVRWPGGCTKPGAMRMPRGSALATVLVACSGEPSAPAEITDAPPARDVALRIDPPSAAETVGLGRTASVALRAFAKSDDGRE